jgi:hypothetical protein
MPLDSTHIVLLQPERLTDQSDGGGQITSVVLPDNVSNNLFPGVSNMDAVNGRLSARALYLGIASANVLWYYGAGIYISQPPANAAISALLARAATFGEERAALVTRIESYLTQGPATPMTFYSNAVVGQRAIMAYQTLNAELPEAGQTVLLSQEKAGYPAVSQYVRLTRVTDSSATFTDGNGDFERRVLTLYLAEPLREDFAGIEYPTRLSVSGSPTKIRMTTVADAARYYGLLPLAAQANAASASVSVSRVLEQLVPSTQAEHAQADQAAQSLPQQMVPGGDALLLASAVIGTTVYLGGGVMPGTVAVTGTQTFADNADGTLTSSGGAVAEIDYVAGAITFPTSGTWTVTAQPAAPLIGPAFTRALPIDDQTRALVYVTTLAPIPAPGTLVVDYLAFGRWYRLSETGSGVLAGASSAHGSGTLNFATGTVQLSLQVLPDLASSVLFSWTTPQLAERRDGEVSIPAPRLAMTLLHDVSPDSLSVSWISGGVTKTATDNSAGVLSGDGVGQVHHTVPALWLTPNANAYPDAASVVTVNYTRLLAYTGALVGLSPAGRTYTLQLPAGTFPCSPGTLAVSATFPVATVGDLTLLFTDNGAGGMVGDGLASGSFNATTGEIILTLVSTLTQNVWGIVYDAAFRGWVMGFTATACAVSVPATTFNYRVRKASDGTDAQTELIPVPDLTLDLTPTTLDPILPGSTRFLLGGQVHIERSGTIYRAVSPTTNSGTAVGVLNHATGIATLSDWTGLSSTTLDVQALATVRRAWATPQVFGRIPGAPVRPGSFQIRATTMAGVDVQATANTQGVIDTAGLVGVIDWQSGIYLVYFGTRTLDSALSGDQKAEPWYDADLIDADLKVIVPDPVWPTTIVYNAVTYTYAPVDSSLIGIDTARLPADGRVQVIKPGDTAVLHHTGVFTMPNPLTAAQVVNLPRGNLSQVILLDTAGTQVATTKYSVNLTTGVVTMANPLDLSTYLQPLAAHHTLREMARVADVEISGQIQLARPLTKTFPADGYLSTVLTAGDRYARYTNLRVIASWQGSFTVDGSLAVADYNDTDFPIVVTNEGCIEEDWAVVFETTTTVKVIGSRVGQIASGLNISGTIAPTSALTGKAYFSIAPGGWGSGYAYGNALRFPTIAASFQHWHIRCTQPHDWIGGGDVYAFQSLGEVDP